MLNVLHYFLINLVLTYTFLTLVICEALNLINGQISYNPPATNGTHLLDATASFTCNTGFYLSGANSAICQAPGAWSQATPQCLEGKGQA